MRPEHIFARPGLVAGPGLAKIKELIVGLVSYNKGYVTSKSQNRLP